MAFQPLLGVPFGPSGRHVVTKESSGLIYATDFSDVSAWAATGVFSQDATRPVYVTSPRSAIKALTRGGVGEPDHSGVRELQITIRPNGTWLLNYGAGDGSGSGGPSTGYPWRPMWAYSATIPTGPTAWTRLYSQGVDCRQQNNPAVTYAARDFLFSYESGGTTYAHIMYADNVFPDPDDDVPMVPYGTDLFTNTDPLTSNWVWQKKILAPNTGADASSYTGSWPLTYNGTNYIFASETDGPPITDFQITYASYDVPGGTYTKSGVKLRTDKQLENPKIWWSETLGTYAKCAFNLGPSPSFNLLQNWDFYGSNPLNWNSDTALGAQRACAADASGLVNLPCPFMGPNGVVYETTDGFVPMTFDGGNTGYNLHEGYYAVKEPSKYNYRFNSLVGAPVFDDTFNRADGGLGTNWASSALSGGGDFSIVSNQCDCGSAVAPKAQLIKVAGSLVSKANGVATIRFSNVATNCGVGVIFRATDPNNFCLVGIKVGVATNAITFYNVVANTYNLLYTVNYNSTALVGVPFDFAVKFNGTTYSIYVNDLGTPVDTTTNATPTTSAGNIGMRNGEAGTGNRLVDEFVVTDLPDATKNTTLLTLSNTDFIAEWAIEPVTVPSSSQFALLFRATDKDNGYYALSDNASNDVLQKVVTGTGTTIGTNTAGVTTVANFQSRFKVKASGTSLSYYIDGELRRSATDATYGSGTKIGFMGLNANFAVRRLCIYGSDTVTINGVPNGATVTLVAADKIPIATGTVSGSSIQLTSEHYPCHGIAVNGVYYPVAGLIYGADVLRFR